MLLSNSPVFIPVRRMHGQRMAGEGVHTRQVFWSFHLLRGPQGDRLRAIATLGDQSQKNSEGHRLAQGQLQETLASGGCRSSCTHRGLNAAPSLPCISAMSPLQYQKHLRLVAARELDAASTAFEVGHESPSQFSGESKRLFGQPPLRDIKARTHGRSCRTVH